MRNIFSENIKVMPGQASPEDALSAGALPASGSYVDVSGYEAVDVVIHCGAINDLDAPSFEIKCADAVDGTLDTLDETNCKKTMLGTDDDQIVLMHVETATLPEDHHFLAVVVGGTVANGSYADIVFFLHGARHLPVSQDSTLCPSDNQLIRAG